MIDLLPFLHVLGSVQTISGAETALRGVLEPAWQPLVDELRASPLETYTHYSGEPAGPLAAAS
jgi:hypothetical protein